MDILAQVTRFILVGGSATIVNWLARFPLSLVMSFLEAVFVAYMIGMVVGFVLYRAFVFTTSSQSLGVQLAFFLGVNAVGVATVILASHVLLHVIFPAIGFTFLPEASAHAVALAMGAAANFVGHKFVTFRAGKPPGSPKLGI